MLTPSTPRRSGRPRSLACSRRSADHRRPDTPCPNCVKIPSPAAGSSSRPSAASAPPISGSSRSRCRRTTACPFCEGHEHMTPRELLAQRRNGSHPDGPAGTCASCPNQFPVLRVEGTLDRQGEGLFDKMNGIGAHEVIIESPRHEDTLATMGECGGGAGAVGVPRARAGSEAGPALPLHHHLQEPRRGGRRVARALAFAADRAADRAARSARRGGRRARALRREGALRVLRHRPAGDAATAGG